MLVVLLYVDLITFKYTLSYRDTFRNGLELINIKVYIPSHVHHLIHIIRATLLFFMLNNTPMTKGNVWMHLIVQAVLSLNASSWPFISNVCRSR